MKRTDFSVDWLFAACAPDTELLPWNAQFTPVDLPHDWQIRHADDLYCDGTLFYRKYFFVTDVPGIRRMLWFGGAYMDTTVFVNGTEVGQWKYGYTSFWFDITDALHEGQNEVLVRCNLRHPNSRWYSGADARWTVCSCQRGRQRRLDRGRHCRGGFRHRRHHGPHADAASDR